MEFWLKKKGYPKIKVQIRRDNIEAVRFYEKIGYSRNDVVCAGKRLIKD